MHHPQSVTVAFAGDTRPDTGRREISGRLLPWGEVAYASGRSWRFLPNSLHWPADVSRVKLNRDHERTHVIGVATRLENRRDGLYGTFRIARTPEGDELLASAADRIHDGFSVEVFFEDGDYHEPDLADPTVTVVHRGTLRGVASTATPAFDDARVDGVAAARTNGASMVRLPDIYAEPALADRARATAAAQGVSFAELARRGLAYVTREAPPYAFAGTTGHSLVRDVWSAKVDGGPNAVDSMDRLSKFSRWINEQRDKTPARFALDTGNTSELIPPRLETAPFMGVLLEDRPLARAANRVPLSSGQPFNLPGQVTWTNATADHVEGTNPSEGGLAVGIEAVTPTAVSGMFRVTRELADSATPAVDAIVLEAMREDYANRTEQMIFVELNGSNGQGGTISSGQVPSGAQVRTATTATLVDELKEAVAAYFHLRRRRPRSVIASSDPAISEVLGDGLVEDSGDTTAQWRLQGTQVSLSAAFTASGADDADVFILGAGDLWVWESPFLQFRYDQRQGPAYIDIAVYATFAARLLRPVGLGALRVTAA